MSGQISTTSAGGVDPRRVRPRSGSGEANLRSGIEIQQAHLVQDVGAKGTTMKTCIAKLGLADVLTALGVLLATTGCSSETDAEATGQQELAIQPGPSEEDQAAMNAHVRGQGCFLYARGTTFRTKLSERVVIANRCCELLLEGGAFESVTSVRQCKGFVAACEERSSQTLLGESLHCPNPITWRAPSVEDRR